MSGQRSPAAQAAVERGEAAERNGNLVAAERAYELAQRHAPSDRNITMAIGRVRLARGEPRASEAFELVARQDDVRDAWICLAGVRRRFGRPDLAATELRQALSRHAPPSTEPFGIFLREVLHETDLPGWCGLTADGVLHVTLHANRTARGLMVAIDGVPVQVPRRGRTQAIDLPEPWRDATQIAVLHDGQALIGSPISVRSIIRCEGFVTARNGGLGGWAWLPGDPDRAPVLTVRSKDRQQSLQVVASEPVMVAHSLPTARVRAFHVGREALARFSGAVEVVGPDRRALTGSPLDPGMEWRSAAIACEAVRRRFPASASERPVQTEALPEMPAVPADVRGPPANAAPAPNRKVDVVIPVYRGLEETLACIASARAGLPRGARIVVVEDASPEPALVDALERLAAQRRIVLHRLPSNRGFPGACNEGLRLAKDRDVVLLNSDTLCPPGWLARLRKAAHSAPDIGTVTPLSNDATIMSYPAPGDGNPVPDLDEVLRIDGWAREADGGALVDLPTAIGFCMYIRRECLDAVGLLREDVFAQGYGEENDFCLRAQHLGWRNVGLPSLFVGHVGGRSFGAAKAHMIARNLRVLERMHPGYGAVVEAWCAADPMAPHRRAIDAVRWKVGTRDSSVVLLTHGREGGVRRRVAERCAELRAEGVRPIVLTPLRSEGISTCVVSDGVDSRFPNLCFAIPGELDALLDLLRAERPSFVEMHHFIGHHSAMLELPSRLGLPSEVVLHDYAWFCPRINLVGRGKRYCGEPDLEDCETCVRDLGTTIEEEIGPKALLARSAGLLGAARLVVTPSSDVARRYRRHLPQLRPVVQAWEDDSALPEPVRMPAGGHLRVAVVGAIGIEKGYEILLACAREAAQRRRPMSFAVVGHTCDDMRLLDVGNVSITGAYDEGDAEALIRTEGAALAFLPSLWPETWCYTLTAAWSAGLQVLAFDIGAPAERIRATGRGWLLPLAAGPGMVNDALMAAFRKGQSVSAA